MPAVRIGTAGWTIPRAHADQVPGAGSHLERYARRLACSEINSTFYRPSRQSTWIRWSASVPADFRFAVKAPKALTHEAALEVSEATKSELSEFLEQTRLLGAKLGPLLFQLPPKQAFDQKRTGTFFEHLKNVHAGAIVLEPRHASWFSAEAESILSEFHISRAAADPAPVPQAAVPGGSDSLVYYRLHGSPRKYYSAYTGEWLQQLAQTLRSRTAETEAWVIFDNTASGAALGDALTLEKATSSP